MKKVIVLLTWNRLEKLSNTLNKLRNQTDNDFHVHISNANLDPNAVKKIDTISSFYTRNGMSLSVTHDGNEYSCFRRFFIARDYASQGYEVVFFLDDDISVPQNYIKNMLKHYRPGSYHSCYAWRFKKDPKDYWKDRTKVFDNDTKIHYGGAGISMTDARIFQDPRLFYVINDLAYQIDDLWMSFYCNYIANIDIVYTNISGVSIGGQDPAALYKHLRDANGDKKSQFLNQLIDAGWKL